MHPLSLLLAILLLNACDGPSGGRGEAPPVSTRTSPLCSPCELPVEVSAARAFEPAAAVNPADARHWLIASKEWHPSGAAPSILRTHVTHDGGASFATRRFPGAISPQHPLWLYTAYFDPNVLLFSDGSALLTAMAARGQIGPGGLPLSAADGAPLIDSFDLIAARSIDGGHSWVDAQVVEIGSGHPAAPVTIYNDQPFMARGPDGEIVLAWSYRVLQGVNQPTRYAEIHAAMSTDQGASWSDPVVAARGGELHRPRVSISDSGHQWIGYQDIGQRGDQHPVYLADSRNGRDWSTQDTGWLSGRGAWLGHAGETLHVSTNPLAAGTPTVILHSGDGQGDWQSEVLFNPALTGDVTPALVVTPAGRVVVTTQSPLANGNAYWIWTRAPGAAAQRLRLDLAPLGHNEHDGILSWPLFGDYQGLAVGPGGVLAAWISGDKADTDLRAAWLRLP